MYSPVGTEPGLMLLKTNVKFLLEIVSMVIFSLSLGLWWMSLHTISLGLHSSENFSLHPALSPVLKIGGGASLSTEGCRLFRIWKGRCIVSWTLSGEVTPTQTRLSLMSTCHECVRK